MNIGLTEVLAFITVFVTICLAIWNYYQQKEIQKLKTKSEKEVFIHQLQFEKEFDIYKDLWKGLVELRTATHSLRPEIENVDPNVSPDEWKSKKLEKLINSYNEAGELFEYNKPFYSDKIYQKAGELMKISRHEKFELEHGDTRRSGYWKEAKQNIDKIYSITDELCELIRERIGIMNIVNSDKITHTRH